MNRAQLEIALEQAVTAHFCKLFDVLMSSPPSDDKAMGRFQDGVERLARMDASVSEFIAGEFL